MADNRQQAPWGEYDDKAARKVKVTWYLHQDAVNAFKRIGAEMDPPRSAAEVLRRVMRRYLEQTQGGRVR